MIIIILGMHKSGTTLISKMLHSSCVNMGDFDESIAYDSGNHYERYEMQEINKSILLCDENLSDNVIRPVYKLSVESKIGSDIKILCESLSGKYVDWGAKDPRTCLTYSIWKKYLPEHKVLFVYRQPEEVFCHYLKYIPKYKIMGRIVKGYKTLRAWYIYNHEASISNSCVMNIEYSDFMNSDEVFNKLSKFITMDLKDCRDKKLYRAKSNGGYLYLFCLFLNKLNGRNIESLYIKLRSLKVG